MLSDVPRPPRTNQADVYCVPSLSPIQHTQAFYNPPAPVSALLIYVTREATWPELPQASGDWEPETRDRFSETGAAQRGGTHVTKHLNMCRPRVTPHGMVNNHTR